MKTEIKASEYEFKEGEYILCRLEKFSAHRPCPKIGEAIILGQVAQVTKGYAFVFVTQVVKGEYSPLLIKLSRNAKYERAYIIKE